MMIDCSSVRKRKLLFYGECAPLVTSRSEPVVIKRLIQPSFTGKQQETVTIQ